MKEWPLMSKVKVKLKLSLLSLCCNQCHKSSAPLEVEMEHKSMKQDIRPNRTMEKKFVILAEVPWYGYRNHFLPDLKPIRHHCEVWKMTAYLQPTFTQLHLRWSAQKNKQLSPELVDHLYDSALHSTQLPIFQTSPLPTAQLN